MLPNFCGSRGHRYILLTKTNCEKIKISQFAFISKLIMIKPVLLKSPDNELLHHGIVFTFNEKYLK